MFALTESHSFFIFSQATDMRKSFDALSGLIYTQMQKSPISGEVFIFLNKNKNQIKLLHWQTGGFVLYYKRLEKGTFKIDFSKAVNNQLQISHAELTMIIAGIELQNIHKLNRFSKSKNMF